MGNKISEAQKRAIAERVREIRNKVGMTQEQFSEKLELSLSAYKKIESAQNNLSLENVCKLEAAFNVSADYILSGEKSNAEEIWKKLLNSAEEDKLKILLYLINYFGKAKDGKLLTTEEQQEVDEVIWGIIRTIDL